MAHNRGESVLALDVTEHLKAAAEVDASKTQEQFATKSAEREMQRGKSGGQACEPSENSSSQHGSQQDTTDYLITTPKAHISPQSPSSAECRFSLGLAMPRHCF
jgi:hypothetical protein